jgi:hypothetical protein
MPDVKFASYDGPERRHRPIIYNPLWRKAVTLWLIAFTALVAAVLWKQNSLASQNKQLIRENQQRIVDIQASRVRGCRETYRRMQLILISSARGQSPARRKRLERLAKLADPALCGRLTQPGP